ncbi:protein LURP-one-related 10-like [Hibiscus syriacus]|uniref:protein LURP-one-related 10-like n=1 Tax=Hibiscus syriacus TaxID=106335 RepID=UPI0019220BAB|nr:protein LURP-one-related 10-like [Hibiscus syriacus]XP_039010682.1 protein LURP-one-related 10-like [Hibiscus syriacus]
MTAAIGEELPPPASEATSPANFYTADSDPIVVIGKKFIVPNPVELKIQQTVFTIAENYLDIVDDNGNPIFKVRDKLFSVHNRRVLFDAAGIPLVSLRQKISSVHRRWKVFRGESEGAVDFLFSVKKSSLILRRMKTRTATSLDIFLASNTSESRPDFKIIENWCRSNCTVFHGDTIIAEMHKSQSVKSLVINADNYEITAYPNVDYAFIIALVVILDEINRNGDG